VACSDCHNSHSGELRAHGQMAYARNGHNTNAQPIARELMAAACKQRKTMIRPATIIILLGCWRWRSMASTVIWPGKLYMTNDLRMTTAYYRPIRLIALEARAYERMSGLPPAN